MKEYKIRLLASGTPADSIDWSVVPRADISEYRWLGGYAPRAFAQLVCIEGEGFLLRMTCEESDPRAVYTEYNDPVYTDSCLEFFAVWDGKADGKYVNLEMNSNGALLSCVGESRHGRVPVKDICGRIFDVKAKKDSDRWSVVASIPFEMLGDIYGIDTGAFSDGYVFLGNFYKCGDDTAIPHYGMWNPVMTENPDFHRPEYFGRFVIVSD